MRPYSTSGLNSDRLDHAERMVQSRLEIGIASMSESLARSSTDTCTVEENW